MTRERGPSGGAGEDRSLQWPGCFNVRDLGGLRARGGRRVARGALVRADSLHRLSAEGWRALLEHGVRTVVDLRDERERYPDRAARPSAIATLHLPLDSARARELGVRAHGGAPFGTPLYYRAHVLRFPELSARVLAAIARAQPGGVAVHCLAGRDRTGLLVMLALALVGVEADEIVADYQLSHARLSALFASLGQADQAPVIEAFLAERGTSAPELIAATLASVDVESQLRAGGLSDSDVQALQARLLEPG
ncbi:MAG TPA: tyrosine-protein phosphatase [Solirubrobacteraceae bacterium]|nr:tyrosine-protein phosphatase [Solirubrobacteraceae bacterium]